MSDFYSLEVGFRELREAPRRPVAARCARNGPCRDEGFPSGRIPLMSSERQPIRNHGLQRSSALVCCGSN